MPTRFNLLDEVPLAKSPGISLGLSRRKSLLTRPSRRSNSRNASLADTENLRVSTIDPKRSGPRFPNELLDEIIKFYFDGIFTASTISRRDSQRVVFSRDIKSLTLVSRDVRYLILRQFCRSLSFLTLRDVNELFDFLSSVAASFNGIGGFTWVRILAVPAFLLPKCIFVLKHFENLQDLVIDCSHCILSSQVVTLSRLFDALSDEDNLLPNLRSFIMTNVPRLDHDLLTTIASSLPQVMNLHISTVEGIETGCCRNCYEESLNRVLHSPIRDIYSNGEDMANYIGLALQGFRNLKNLHLGILLSSCDLLDKHAKHGDVNGNDVIPSTVKSIRKCPHCAKHAQETRRRELSTSLAIANHLPSLETVSWVTAFSLDSSRDGQITEENCVECVVGSFSDSFQYSIINTGHFAEEVNDDLWKIICFAVQRTNDKIRLLRTA